MERPSAAKKKNQNNAKAKRAHGGEIQPEKSFGGSDFQLDKTPWILVSAGDWRAASASQSLLSPYKKQAICLLFSWITQGEAHKSAKSSFLLIPAPSQRLRLSFCHKSDGPNAQKIMAWERVGRTPRVQAGFGARISHFHVAEPSPSSCTTAISHQRIPAGKAFPWWWLNLLQKSAAKRERVPFSANILKNVSQKK